MFDNIASSLPDFSAGILAWFCGLFLGVLFLAALLEAIVMYLRGWRNFGRCLVIAIVMNMFSAMVGYFTETGYNPIERLHISLPLNLAIGWAVSVLIEWPFLNSYQNGQTRRNLITSMLANLASYLMVILPAYLKFH